MPDDALRERCQQVVETVLTNNGWALASADDASFLEAVQRRVAERFADRLSGPAEVLDDAIARAAKNVYCTLLYQAYRQDGADRQLHAMTEAKRFVYRRLLVMTDGDEALADECAQDAVSQAWLHWHDVRDPGSFLGYILRIGVNGVLAARRHEARQERTSDTGTEQPDDSEFGRWNVQLEQMIEMNELLRQVYETILRCLSRAEEVRVVVEHVLLGKSYKELAESWGRRAGYLHLLKFRALKNLQNCEEFRRLRAEWRGQE